MLKTLKLLALLLVVPAVSYAVAVGVQAKMNWELHATLAEEYPDLPRQRVAAATLEDLCASGATVRLPKLCTLNDNLGLMRWTALWAAGVALALLGAIWLAGRWARTDRTLLVRLFRPGLYVTIAVLSGLVVTNAALAIAAIYFGESALVNRIHVGIILAISLGAGMGVLGMIQSCLSLVRKAQITVVGQTLTREEAPELWKGVDAAASKLGALVPDHIVVGLEPNFFVTEAHVRCLTGELQGRTLYCSLPLGRILTDEEFDAVVGHELGHFKGEDTKFSEHFYPIYRGTALSLQALQEAGSEGARAVPLLPAIATLGYFYDSFAVAESQLGRDREIAADAAGASVASAPALASALVKVHAFSSVWAGFDDAALEAMREGQAFRNASALFAGAVQRAAGTRSFDGLDAQQLPHPTDSHPPLGARLTALRQDMTAIADAARNVTPTRTALDRIEDPEKLEEALSRAYQTILARQHGLTEDEP